MPTMASRHHEWSTEALPVPARHTLERCGCCETAGRVALGSTENHVDGGGGGGASAAMLTQCNAAVSWSVKLLSGSRVSHDRRRSLLNRELSAKASISVGSTDPGDAMMESGEAQGKESLVLCQPWAWGLLS
jgi:hypothetical protein